MNKSLLLFILALRLSCQPGIASETGSNHWAFVAPRRPALPQSTDGRSKNPIDAFIRERLAQTGLKPSPTADRTTLIRRLSLDLLGLPPTLEEVQAWLQDDKPLAYERLVERLLASPHFGERWGRHWLDLARYADSDGYEKDNARPYAYFYRDWVIHALNRDMPFDQFTIEQLAGDLLPAPTEAQRVATGFHRQTLTNKEGGVDQEEFRCKAIVDRASTTATLWLGLTLGCAECHNHKFDPISQREFYEFYAFFNNASEKELPLPTPAEQTAHDAAFAQWKTKLDDLEAKLARLAPDAVKPDSDSEKAKDDPAEDTPEPAPKSESDASILKLKRELQKHRKAKPILKAPAASVFQTEKRDTYIHVRGDFLQKGDPVQPGVPAVLHRLQPRGQTADRLDLARWLVSPENPLTGRVIVNHVWRELFGRGLVATENDFGTRGDRPSHPELLDWLACEFQGRTGARPALPSWSLKQLIRLIVTSETYRQSSAWRSDVATRDPLNTLLARQNRFRVEAEVVRDIALSVSGQINPKIGGPSFKPPLPADLAQLSYANGLKWEASSVDERHRRALYIHFQRTVPFPMLTTFDAPESNVTCTRRERSNSPLQALTLLNNETFTECAQALGRRISAQSTNTTERLRYGFRLATCRLPTAAEFSRLAKFWSGQRLMLGKTPEAAKTLSGDSQAAGSLDAATCVAYARVLLNLDETITRE